MEEVSGSALKLRGLSLVEEQSVSNVTGEGPERSPPAEEDTGGGDVEDGGLLEACDLFAGKGLFDEESRPLYKEEECTFMTEQLTCMRNGRQDDPGYPVYQKWRWQPTNCSLPRLPVSLIPFRPLCLSPSFYISLHRALSLSSRWSLSLSRSHSLCISLHRDLSLSLCLSPSFCISLLWVFSLAQHFLSC